MGHIARAASFDTSVLLGLECAAECFCNQRALEISDCRIKGWRAGSHRERVNKFENEEARKGAAEIGNTK